MAKLKYDLSEIADFVDLESGRFRAKLLSCSKGKSKSSGNPTLTWEWLILSGPNKGQKARSWTSLQEHALSGLKQHLLAFGFKKTVDVDTEELLGKKVTLVIGSRPRKLDDGRTVQSTGVTAVLPLASEEDEGSEEEEKPKKKKRQDDSEDEDDEEEDRPKKKKKKDEDEDEEDEEEKPRKKKKKSDDDDDDEPF